MKQSSNSRTAHNSIYGTDHASSEGASASISALVAKKFCSGHEKDRTSLVKTIVDHYLETPGYRILDNPKNGYLPVNYKKIKAVDEMLRVIDCMNTAIHNRTKVVTALFDSVQSQAEVLKMAVKARADGSTLITNKDLVALYSKWYSDVCAVTQAVICFYTGQINYQWQLKWSFPAPQEVRNIVTKVTGLVVPFQGCEGGELQQRRNDCGQVANDWISAFECVVQICKREFPGFLLKDTENPKKIKKLSGQVSASSFLN